MSKMFGLDCLDRQCNSEVNVLLLLVVVGLVCCFAVGDGVCILWCLFVCWCWFVCLLFVGVGLFVCCDNIGAERVSVRLTAVKREEVDF